MGVHEFLCFHLHLMLMIINLDPNKTNEFINTLLTKVIIIFTVYENVEGLAPSSGANDVIYTARIDH